MKTYKLLLEKTIKKFGSNMQHDIAIEEMSELTKEIIKNRRGKNNTQEIIDEIADVWIMMEQLKIIYGEIKVDLAIDRKIERLHKLVGVSDET